MKLWNYDLLDSNIFILSYLCIKIVDCQCVLPFSNGTWITSSRGTWTIPENRTEIQNFRGSLIPSQTTYDLTCVSSSGNQYVLGTSSALELFAGIIVNSYTCIEIRTTSQSPTKYEFYFVTAIDEASGEPFTSDVNLVCDGTATETGSNTNIVIADGTSAGTVKETLTNVIRGNYRVTVTDQMGVTSNETLLDSCNDTNAFYVTEVENAAQIVSAIGFSDSGVLYNIKSFTVSGITYIYTYSNDTSVNSITTFRFTCWAVAQDSDSSIVHATVYPEVCQDGQNATYVPSGGQVLILDPSADISTGDAGLSLAVIAVIVLVCIVVVVVIIIAVIYFVRKKKRKDLSKPLPNNIKGEKDDAPGRKGVKRPKSSNDLDSARLTDEKNKQKIAKKMAKKKETRTIAVQASIWTAPIKRTTTALTETIKRSSTRGSIHFIPYVDKPVIKTNPTVCSSKSAVRSNTTLEFKNLDIKQQAMIRSKTIVDGKVSQTIPKYLVKKNIVSTPRKKLIKQMSEVDDHSVDHYADEFEKRFPFPNEGNPNNFHNTLDIPDESNDTRDTRNHKEETTNLRKVKQIEDNMSAEPKQNSNRREFTKTSLRSRPSTTDGCLGVKLNRSGSVRKTNSEQMDRSKTIMKFSYNSPYAMSETQKEYQFKKANWIRNQVSKDKESKKQIEEMRRLEGQMAFDAWIKNKRKSITSARRKFSTMSSKTSKVNTSVVNS